MTFNLNLLNKNKFKILIFVVCCVLVLVLIRQLVKAQKKEPFYQVVADDVLYTREVDIQPELNDADLQTLLDNVNTCNFDTTQDVAVRCLGGTNNVFIHKGITEIKADFVSDQDTINHVIFEPGGTDDLVIGDNAFSGTSITRVHIPARVREIGNNAFTSLNNITFENGSRLNEDSISKLNESNTGKFTVSKIDTELPEDKQNINGITFEHSDADASLLVEYTETNGYFSDVCGGDQEEWQQAQSKADVKVAIAALQTAQDALDKANEEYAQSVYIATAEASDAQQAKAQADVSAATVSAVGLGGWGGIVDAGLVVR